MTLTVIEDDGGSEVVEPWRLSWDTTRPTLTGTRALTLNRANLLQVEQSCSAHVRVELHGQDGTKAVRRIPGLTVLPPRQWRLAGGERWAGAHPIRVEGIHGERPHGNNPLFAPFSEQAHDRNVSIQVEVVSAEGHSL